jgi:hypothetical protein
MKENGKPKKLALPAGLVIPKLQNERVARVRIRRATPYNDSRYCTVPGSDMGALLITGREDKTVVVVESDLDALLIWQAAGDLVTVMALGSAQARPDQQALRTLENAKEILVALDVDDAGAKEAWQWWSEHFGQARRWPPVGGKDPGEMVQTGVDVRLWVQAGLSGMIHDDPVEACKATVDAEAQESNFQSEEVAAPDCGDNAPEKIDASIEGHVKGTTHFALDEHLQPMCESCSSWTESFPSASYGVCRNISARHGRFQDRTRTGCKFHS